MTKYYTFLDSSTAAGNQTILGVQQNGGEYGVGISSAVDLNVSSITVNSSNSALTVTQTGSGHALLVQDSASPDSSPFVVDANGNVYIGTTGATGTTSQPLQVTGGGYFSGNVGIGNTDPQAKLHVSGGNIKVDSGYGIDFSATANSSGTMTSELLSDYEEGTWTPTLPNGGTLIIESATYTKIGRFVSIYVYVSLVQPTNNSNEFRIGGLPYTSMGSASYHTGSIGYTESGNLNDWRPIVLSSGSYIYFHVVSGSNLTRSNANFVTLNNKGALLLNLSYYTN